MRYKTLFTLGLIGALISGAIGCNSKKEENLESKIKLLTPIVRTINGNKYKFEGNKVTELSSDEDNLASYGVISDIHGEVEKARAIAQEFKNRDVDGIILPGDIPLNEQLRYSRKDLRDDKTEIKKVLSAIAETGLPVFVIPGNHERKSDYEVALREISSICPNIIDMTQYRVFDGDDVDFVSLPGYQTFKIPGRQFIPDDGYWANPKSIKEIGKLREGLDDVVVLIAHGAGKTDSKIGPGAIYDGKDVGDELTREIQKEHNIPFAVVGHIHEAGGKAAAFDGVPVKQKEWAEQFTANFGTLERWKYLNGEIYDGMAGTIIIKGNKAMYEMLVLK